MNERDGKTAKIGLKKNKQNKAEKKREKSLCAFPMN